MYQITINKVIFGGRNDSQLGQPQPSTQPNSQVAQGQGSSLHDDNLMPIFSSFFIYEDNLSH